MEVFWQRGSISIREVQEALPAPRPAYTSVQTTIYRLEAKDAVRRVRKIGNAHIFEAAVNRNTAHRRLLDHVLGLFGGRIQPVMAHWAESGNITGRMWKTPRNYSGSSLRQVSPSQPEGEETVISFALNHIWQSTIFTALVALLAWLSVDIRQCSLLALDVRLDQISGYPLHCSLSWAAICLGAQQRLRRSNQLERSLS